MPFYRFNLQAGIFPVCESPFPLFFYDLNINSDISASNIIWHMALADLFAVNCPTSMKDADMVAFFKLRGLLHKLELPCFLSALYEMNGPLVTC